MVSVLVVLAAVGVVLYGNATKEPYVGTLPRTITTGQPSAQPSTSTSPTESPIASPTADPSMLPMTPSPLPPGVVAPTAPRALASTGKTQTTATLSWQPPANAGTGGLSRYRVFKGMAEIGTALGTSFTATGLTPKTTYGFSVLAVNHAGASSPPSNSVAVTTDPTPPPTPPDAKVWVDPGSEVSYGLAFSIVGGSWPCTASAQIDIYMANMLIAKASTDANGRFEVWPEVITEPTHAKIPVLGPSGDYLVLQRDKPETVRAVLTSQPQCSATAVRTTTVTFVSPE
jgi:hypothetical protein